MMHNDVELKTFQQLLKIRSVFKSLTQLSFSVTQFEKKYPLTDATPSEIDTMFDIYKDYIEELKKLVVEADAVYPVKK